MLKVLSIDQIIDRRGLAVLILPYLSGGDLMEVPRMTEEDYAVEFRYWLVQSVIGGDELVDELATAEQVSKVIQS